MIGITFGGEPSATAFNYVLPSNLVLRIVPALIQAGHYDHPWLAFSGGSL